MALLAKELDACIHEPPRDTTDAWDRVRAKIAGPPQLWNMARILSKQLKVEDCVYCVSEAGGLQVAAYCGGLRNRPKICVFVHNMDRPRRRLALKLWHASRHVDLFLACSQWQVDFLRQYLKLPSSRVRFIWDHTDTQFFSPGPSSSDNARPKIISVGLEQRDYRTLATATENLDVDVAVSGFSEDAASRSRTFPEKLPANMTRRFYPWPELLQLYRDAAVVVVSVHENKYAAGVQALMEAMACRRPVVATMSSGLETYLDTGCVAVVKPADAIEMRSAILACLNSPNAAANRAQRGYELARVRYSMERYVDEIANHLRSLKHVAVS